MNADAAAQSLVEPVPPTTTRDWYSALRAEMAKVVIGQGEFVEQLLLTLLCREHALLEGPIGTAKWSAIEALGRCCGLTTRRIRCSPDLGWDELLGRGPAVDPWQASLLLVDNVDDLSAKARNLVQQAMCQRVVERQNQVSAVPDPFVVFATRYQTEAPVVEETADPLDDRFLFQIHVPYPTYDEEYCLAERKSGPVREEVARVVGISELNAWRSLIPRIEASPSVIDYAVRLVRATRVHEGENPDFIFEWVQQGAGPRAAHFLLLAAKARATTTGRATVSHDDIQAVCPPVLRHRILTNRNARVNGIGSDQVIRRLLQEVSP
jgi:MoxR-like ATPase